MGLINVVNHQIIQGIFLLYVWEHHPFQLSIYTLSGNRRSDICNFKIFSTIMQTIWKLLEVEELACVQEI